MRNLAAALALSTLAISSPAQPTPAFEVASVKLAADTGTLSVNTDAGMLRYSNVPLRPLIGQAYGVDTSRVQGGPAWLDSQTYDISAKLPAGSTKDQIPAMLRRLLEERFKLSVHQETREQRVFALVVAKDGPKLKPADKPSGNGSVGPGRLVGHGMSLAHIASMLKRPAGLDVVDRTGISGAFDLELKWRTDDQADGADLFTAIQEQLGLKLEPSKAPVVTVIVDSLERVPIEN
jgi:uncharacterized protein (TIGR03435 family)